MVILRVLTLVIARVAILGLVLTVAITGVLLALAVASRLIVLAVTANVATSIGLVGKRRSCICYNHRREKCGAHHGH